MEERKKAAAKLRKLADALEAGKGPAAVVVAAHQGKINVSAVGYLEPEATMAVLKGLKIAEEKLKRHLAKITESHSVH